MSTLQNQEKGRRESLGVQSDVLAVLIIPGIVIFVASLIITLSSTKWWVEKARLATRIDTRANALQTYMVLLGKRCDKSGGYELGTWHPVPS
jgi:hypothetical protein